MPVHLSEDEIAGLIGIRVIEPFQKNGIYTLEVRD